MSDLRQSAQEGSHSLFITQSQDWHTINSAVFYLLKVNHKSSSIKRRWWHQHLNIRRWFEAACWWDCQPQTHANFLPGMLKVAMLRLRGQQPKRALTWHCVWFLKFSLPSGTAGFQSCHASCHSTPIQFLFRHTLNVNHCSFELFLQEATYHHVNIWDQ